MAITNPVEAPALPDEAVVILPLASTVKFVDVYEAAVTPEVASVKAPDPASVASPDTAAGL